MFSSLELGSNN